MVHLLLPQRTRTIGLAQTPFTPMSAVIAASAPTIRYPAETALVRDAITTSAMPTAWIEMQLKGVGKAEKQDVKAPKVHLRTAVASPPRFRVGDIVEGYSGAGEFSFNLITCWWVKSIGEQDCTRRVYAARRANAHSPLSSQGAARRSSCTRSYVALLCDLRLAVEPLPPLTPARPRRHASRLERRRPPGSPP